MLDFSIGQAIVLSAITLGISIYLSVRYYTDNSFEEDDDGTS